MRAVIKGSRGGVKDLAGRSGSGGLNAHSAAEIGSSVPDLDTASFSSEAGGGKPWKKHHNRNKKEKIKRIHHA